MKKTFPNYYINKVCTKEKLLRLLNSEEFSKFMLPNKHNNAHLGNVADLGNWSRLASTKPYTAKVGRFLNLQISTFGKIKNRN